MQAMGNAPGLYDKAVLEVSIKNQIKWRNNIGEPDHIPIALFWSNFFSVRFVQRDERKYYDTLLQYSREHYVVSGGVKMVEKEEKRGKSREKKVRPMWGSNPRPWD